MWVFLNNAFISIVSHRTKPDILLVRARFQDDIKAIFPKVQVITTLDADYLYRAEINRSECSAALSEKISAITYDNFKNTVTEQDRHDVYLDVWSVMFNAQANRNKPPI